jgi:molybdenum cofactor synthesis domain-containing protein
LEKKFTLGIITASDKGSKGEREDLSGVLIKEMLEKLNYETVKYIILPDDLESLKKEMIYMADELKVDLLLTTGGTGFSKRDNTPEATREILDKLAPGISEGIRYYSLQITPKAILSRAVAGIRKDTLIINLPGSPKAVKESLEYILNPLEHGLEILKGTASECADKK